MLQQSNYVVEVDDPAVVVIRDVGPWDKYKTVTNAAEAVVSELYARYGDRRFLYYDSSGDRDELCHKAGVFTGFRPAREG